MDSFAKKYLLAISAVVTAVVLYNVFSSDERVERLNALLAADEILADYPYPFRVFRLEGEVAVMGSPRSAEVPVMQFLRTAYPELSKTAVDDPAMMAAQDVLARTQVHAQELIEAQAEVSAVRWELDERWFNTKGVFLDY